MYRQVGQRDAWSHRALLAVSLCAVTSACESPDPFAGAPSQVPEVFAPGAVSTELREYGITFAPRGTEAYFTRRGRRGQPQIFVTRHVDGRWTEAAPARFARPGDEAPFVTAPGSRLLFTSRRPLPESGDDGANLWEVRRTDQGWSDARPLAGAVNTPGTELERYTLGAETGASLLPDGTLLYTLGTDPEWGSDLYVAEPDGDGGFSAPRPLLINSYGDEANAVMSPGGRYLIFQGYREASGVGEQDLYVAERTAYGWGEPHPLPEPLNSRGNDGYPAFSPDGRTFFFASDRHGRSGYYSVYFVQASALGLDFGAR